MPSYYFELFTMVYHLTIINGKPPAMRELADALGASYSAVVKRAHKMVELKYLMPFERYAKRDWFHPTIDGSQAYIQCLSKERLIFFDPSIGALSPSHYARFPGALYKKVSRREYTAQIEKILTDGPLGATL